ncbi:hypothetical protein FJTKL_04926 [Diaporthe vaccinii]|uniref:Autophagy-related protein 1 n=1 Tax=Diaporthe vaccinii TaxID=105482 RepID=A0ABR4DS53_9PEZI
MGGRGSGESELFTPATSHAALHELYLKELGPQLALAVPGINQLDLDSIPESSARSQGNNPYELHVEIGSGAFGTVYKGMHSYTGDFVAIKVFHRRDVNPSKEAIKGDRILESLSHPNIAKFIAFISPRTGPRMLVMELLEHQNLEESHREQPLLEDNVRDLIRELLCGLEYLHSKHVTHRDLKPTNIIIVEREPMCIKITDFGLAKRSDQLRSCCGSGLYAAPEVYDQRPYSDKVDMWSVGVIALEMADGLPDFPTSERESWPALLEERLEAAPLHAEFYLFVRPLLRSDPNQRPPAHVSLKSRFLHVESHFLDAIGSPTEYAPTPPEYRDQYEEVPARAPAPTYLRLKYAGATVMYRPNDGLVNVTQLLKAIGYKRTVKWASLDERIGDLHRTAVIGGSKRSGFYVQGSYVSMMDAERILNHLGLSTALLQVLIVQIDDNS